MGEVQLNADGMPSLNGPSTGLTTPDAVVFQGALHDFVQAGVKACAVEASSIGLVEHRLEGTRVRVALFTNFTQDHLDYHGSMAAYWQAKLSLFDMEGLRTFDDPMVVSLDEFMASGHNYGQGKDALFDELVASRTPDDLAILVYTSGTTG
jgi:UDP-N-acetylmuramyl tripeptide synthase